MTLNYESMSRAWLLKDYKFLEEGEQKPVTVPIADSYTNAVVDAVAPSMN